ncbi:MAG: type II secretion system F family protein [Candidatus Sericytochromatia bacterium]|nr:type II secretion system F family protein [Candidatus Tanganyikabacteria bacterium]
MDATVFLVASGLAMGILALLPDRGLLAARARMRALETAGPGLVPAGDARLRRVLQRRVARATRRFRSEALSLAFRTAGWLALTGAALTALWAAFATATANVGPARAAAVCLFAAVTTAAAAGAWLALRRALVARQIPETLDRIAGHLAAANSFFGAVDMVADRGPWPIRSEFRRIASALRDHATIEQALAAFARRIPNDQARLLAHVFAHRATIGQALVPGLRAFQGLLARYAEQRAGAAMPSRLLGVWQAALLACALELLNLGFGRADRPWLEAGTLAGAALAAAGAWWVARRARRKRRHLELRLGLDPGAPGGSPADPTERPESLAGINRVLTLATCLLAVGLGLESAIGAVALGPGTRPEARRLFLSFLHELRSGTPPHLAAAGLASRTGSPELRRFSRSLEAAAAGSEGLAEAAEAAVRESLASWADRSRAAAIRMGARSGIAALLALPALLAWAFLP